MNPRVQVAAAVIERPDGSFLMACRPEGKAYAGWWEFPGGKVEAGETAREALVRELEEELGTQAAVESAREAHLVYEERLAGSVALEQREHPLPVLFTISANLHPEERHPDCGILAIVTFLASLGEGPTPADLFGLLVVPREALKALFAPKELSLGYMRAIPGLRLEAREPLPEKMVLVPVWTARSLHVLIQSHPEGVDL